MQLFKKHISSKNHEQQLLLKQSLPILAQKQTLPKYKCGFCNKEYIRQKPFIKHQTKCNNPSNSLIPAQQMGHTTQITTNTNTNTNSNNITTNNINLTQNNNNNIIIMPFGSEDLSMIPPDMQKYIISRGFSAYSILLDELYKNPQNNNIHLYDKRNKLVKYLDADKKVKVTKFKEIVEDIVYANIDRIDEFLDEHYDSLDDKKKKYAAKLMDEHSNITKKKDRLKEYNTITDCKLNEIAPQCKKNFQKLNQSAELTGPNS
jgi:hypothetical protein